MLDLRFIASCLPGGRVVSGGVSFRAPGHGVGDQSARILPAPGARNGYTVTSFAGDDPLTLRDFIDAQCGLPRWDERERHRDPDHRELVRQAQVREQQRQAREVEERARAEQVTRIWREARPDPRGTLVERYLNEHRGLALPHSVCGHAIRFHPAGPWQTGRAAMMICSFRDISTNEVVGLHRTRLDPETGAKVARKMLGRAGAAAIKLTPDADVALGVALAEGVESALAGMSLGLVPMWATGSVGGIAAFPVLSSVETLTVCAEVGEASERAVQEVGTRWTESGRDVRIVRPRFGSDLNDAIREAVR